MDIQEFISFISQYGGIIGQAVSAVFLFVITIVQIAKYGKVSKEVKDSMPKYRLEDYQKNSPVSGQTFSRIVPEYQYDEKTKSLVVVGTKDLQEIIQSSADCALNKILDKFGCLPPEMQAQVTDTDEVNIVDLTDDLEDMSNAINSFEEMRERYGFPVTMSYNQMFDEINKIKSDFDKKVEVTLAKQSKKEEVKEDEKKN